MPPLLLMVDDAPETALVVQLLARRAGHEVICTTDGPSLLSWLTSSEARKPDLLLLDLRLPPTGGIALYRSLKRTTRALDGVPVALFTQGPSPAELGKALQAGIDFLVSKECLVSLEKWTGRVNDVLTVAAHPPTPIPASATPLHAARLREGLARVMAHPSLALLEGEGIRGLWARVWIRVREEFSSSQDIIDVPLSSVTLGQLLTRLAASRADVVNYLIALLGHQFECLLGRSIAMPLQAALADVSREAGSS